MSSGLILLVEDNPDDVFLARRALGRCKVASELAVTVTGEEALAFLLGSPDAAPSPRPRLVLLDLQLPGIPGIEVLRRLRADARTRTLPVVVLTSSRVPADIAACYQLGANGFVQKDVDFDRFQECMSALTEYWLRINVSP